MFPLLAGVLAMSRMKTPLCTLCLALFAGSALLAGDMNERIGKATSILAEKQGSNHPIPQILLDNADAVAIFAVTQAGFVIGGTGGEGILVMRLAPAGPATPPPGVELTPFEPGANPEAEIPSDQTQYLEPTPAPGAPSSTTQSTTTAVQPDGTVVRQTTTTTVTPPSTAPGAPPDPTGQPSPAIEPGVNLPPATPPPPVRHWSAPSAFDVAGGSFGAQIGATTRQYIILLKGQDAIDVFTNPGKVSWDASAQGMIGDTADGVGVSELLKQKIVVYRSTQGAYGGATMAGTSISLSNKINMQAYGTEGVVRNILNGSIPSPPAAKTLYQILDGVGP